ncbi:unnamed protein product [Miscanthus lutarioriparius]|uniref:Uncharacterized protein n=1 Tax=Miscanthus lutarioriparius TaxID=422564 RepID=A0A811R6L5_9POAL|nr:unnamed protein product [Miscanthus lutarioriparius]
MTELGYLQAYGHEDPNMHTTNEAQLYGQVEPNIHPQVLAPSSQEYWVTWRVYDIFFLIQVYGILCRLALAVGFNTDSGGSSVGNELLMVVRKQVSAFQYEDLHDASSSI